MKMAYEQFTCEDGVIHERAKVPGGWFVRVHNHLPYPNREDILENACDYGYCSFTAFFYPDPNHEWSIEEDPE